MATFIILPDGITSTNNWQNPSDGACAASNVDNDNADTDYCYETANGHRITFTFPSPSVSEAAISSITSVQLKFKASYTQTSGTTDLYTQLLGTDIDHAVDNHSIASGGSYATYSGDLETDSDDDNGDDWEYSHLNAIQVHLRKNGFVTGRTQIRVSYLYLEVIYVPAGYTNDVIGIDGGDISTVNGISTTDISKVNGV